MLVFLTLDVFKYLFMGTSVTTIHRLDSISGSRQTEVTGSKVSAKI